MLGLGTPELALILLIGLLLFGGKKLPELAHSVGTAAKELKKGFHEDAVYETNTVKPSTAEQPKSDS
jgi:sec-independent protein translocase protein TatA